MSKPRIEGYKHTLNMEGGQTRVRYVETAKERPFGKPGTDYSREYPVTVTRLVAESKVFADINIDAAARVLAAHMDYPWTEMPEEGRDRMRKHAKEIVDAAMGKPS